MDKVYNPKIVEEKWQRFWEERHFSHPEPVEGRESYSIVIPPPNVTDKLHLGHALNNTIQDILIRFKRLQGYVTEWMPGTDHAGIATQNVVERKIAREQGKTRNDLGRERFIGEMWKFKEATGGTIIKQLKRMGCSCDWDRERFTMDEGLSKAVSEVFVRLYEKGLIYRGNYIINWCPRCQTALSDEEAEHRDVQGSLWYIRYPGPDGSDGVTVATTRPETMLGDVAVAVNPEDDRFRHLVGATVVLPIMNREIPVIADKFVDPKFGTGAVKVTPAHDPNDFEIGQRHGIDPIVVMNEDGTMNARAGADFDGIPREDARKLVVEKLENLGLLLRIEAHEHAVGHCYRCDTVTEPYLSTQWFVKMKPLAEPAVEMVKNGRVAFHPERWTKVYLNWMENIRDWCISRQLWWGHRIPVYYCDSCGHTMVSRGKVTVCKKCGSDRITQDPDVLDTWFSSWLWPFSTFGWPDETPELRAFYPTNTLSTASEIIFFWVARMIMAGLEFMGDIPFSQVYIHGTVRDDNGRKMSKSLGNGVDPLDVIDSHGADALRFSMMIVTAQGQDVFVSYPRPGGKAKNAFNTFDIGRNFANKIWNATRMILSRVDGVIGEASGVEEELSDRWICSRFNRTAGDMAELIEAFRFNDASRKIYDFIWHDFCDWYLEMIKPRIDAGGGEKTFVLRNAAEILAGSMQLLHPIMPYITEEIWQILTEATGSKTVDSIMISALPLPDESAVDDRVEADMEALKSVITTIRTIRNEMNVPLGKKADVIVIPADNDMQRIFFDNRSYILDLAAVDSLTLDMQATHPPKSAAGISGTNEVFVILEGLIDIERERARITKEIDRRTKFIKSLENKLQNEDFLAKAPREVVRHESEKLDNSREELKKLTANLEAIEC
ncbi:MAG: valine--tRNA ligase [Candidatus Latescibacteria bacterium]|nr:valine--tRNA ligase [Candidatus Latescibacterota bacterium]